MPQTHIRPGLIVLHSNLSESLAETVVTWLSNNPLNPLEEEIFLVQSNGMAEWLKMELATMGGVYAATRVALPAKFMWQTYRQVLGRDAVPSDSPLDKIPMTWRVMKLLPTLLSDPDFEPIDGFLKADEPDRQLQLAARLADQFDQYQIYRADWLEAWASGRDVLMLGDGSERDLPPDQRWQPKLWRALLGTLSEPEQEVIRPRLHRKVLDRLMQSDTVEAKVARRVVVFCVSQFPLSSLKELAALSRHAQVILAVFNPCRHYWGDIIEGREMLRAIRRRHANRDGIDLGAIDIDQMHLKANALLASWGRQSRDFIRQLDEFDDATQTRLQFASLKLDLFDDTAVNQGSMLQRIQRQIRDLEPTPPSPDTHAIARQDRSIVFHVAHSKVREIEILHDCLLQYLSQPSTDGKKLQPRDIVVMVPDIEQMAPAIRAVFGQYKRTDQRFIPFDISDLGAQADSPLISAVEWLLRIPQQRTRLSELIDLLEVPAIAGRFGISQDALPKLVAWMEGSGIRWGLNQGQRHDLQLDACGEQNTALFGLQRMLLGYCSGSLAGLTDDNSFNGIDPYVEVGGLEAELAGSLAHFLKTLTDWWTIARVVATPDEWVQRGRQLLTSLVSAKEETDKQAISALNAALNVWQRACEQADYVQQVPLSVARASWLEALDRPTLNRRFRAGGVTFCSLMPMRVIPFEVVCLLGMNEGDYPRASVRSDFDLMKLKGVGRPGDRSRREDDRQLLLEAVLSARRTLYVSWTGKSVKDNSDQPPSVLIAQLRDYLQAHWGNDCVDSRTTFHPLQPFSRKYFEPDSGLRTYASEWRAAHSVQLDEQLTLGATQDDWKQGDLFSTRAQDSLPTLTIQQLVTFLRNPVKAFFRQRLSVVFDHQQEQDFDDEPFGIDHLERYYFVQELLADCPADLDADSIGSFVDSRLAQMRRAGRLPPRVLGELVQDDLEQVLKMILGSLVIEKSRCGIEAPRCSVRTSHDGVVLEDWLHHLHEPGAEIQGEEVEAVGLSVESGKLCEQSYSTKKSSVRPDRLMNAWVMSLVAASCDVKLRQVIVGRDVVAYIQPVNKELAKQVLDMLMSLWKIGMARPVPLPLKTAIAYAIASAKSTQDNPVKRPKPAVDAYEGQESFSGGDPKPGENQEMCLSREYPDFDALLETDFVTLAPRIYLPLIDWCALCVTTHPHASGFSTDDDHAEDSIGESS